MNTEQKKEASGGSEEFGSVLQQIEELQRKMQQMKDRVAKVEEFLSKVVERFLPKVEELLASQSTPANNPPSPSGKRNNGSLEMEKEFGSRLQLLEQKQMEEQRRQKEVEELKRKQQQMEEFLSNVVGRVLPKVDELLALHSTPPTAAPQAEKGATTIVPSTSTTATRPSTTIPATRPSTTTSLLVPAPRSLFLAAARGDAQTVRQMLTEERGGEISEELEGCLLVARNANVVTALLGDARLSLNEDMKERAMLAAVQNNRVSALEALLQNGFRSRNAFYEAAMKGTAACLRLLLDAGYDVDMIVDGETALHRAAINAYEDCVRLLLEAGADVTATDSYSNTPLHNAAYRGATQCVQLLLNAGADVHAIGNRGVTPLHFAAQEGSTHCARLLLDAGADVNAPSQRGTPLKVAQVNKQEDTALFLREKGGRLN